MPDTDPKKIEYHKKMKAFDAIPDEQKIALAAMLYSKTLEGAAATEFQELSLKKILAACEVDFDKIEERLREIESERVKRKNETFPDSQMLLKAAMLGKDLRDVLEVLRRYGLPWGLTVSQIQESFNVKYLLPDTPPAVEAFLFNVAKIIDEGPQAEARIAHEVNKRTSAFEDAVKFSLSNLKDADKQNLALRLAAAAGGKAKAEGELGRTKKALEEITAKFTRETGEGKKRSHRLKELFAYTHGKIIELRDRAHAVEYKLKETTQLLNGVTYVADSQTNQLNAVHKTLEEEVKARQEAEKAKEALEKNLAEVRKEKEKLDKDLTEAARSIANREADLREKDILIRDEKEKTQTQVSDVAKYRGLYDAERKRAGDLAKKVRGSRVAIASGGLTAIAASIIAMISYFNRPAPKVEKVYIETKAPVAEAKPVPAESVKYFGGGFIVEFGQEAYLMSPERKEDIDKQIKSESDKLKRELTPAEKKAVYEKNSTRGAYSK
jgi:hypothetical protein